MALPRNSVGAPQIKSSAVRSAEVKNRSLTAKDFKPGQLPQGARGPAGPSYGNQSQGYTGTTPPTGQQFASEQVVLALPTSGRVYAYGRGIISATCSGAAEPIIGLYLDKAPIPGTAHTISEVGSAVVEFAGLSGQVAAGARELQIGVGCEDEGDVTSVGYDGELYVGGLLVGS